MGRFLAYARAAFLLRWNLLAVGAATAAGLISGRPDAVLPLVAAAEVLFLAGLATRPKWQAYVDARARGRLAADQSRSAEARKAEILRALAGTDRREYDGLKNKCVELRRLYLGLQPDGAEGPALLGDARTQGINTLLWIYLKMLHARGVLRRFFDETDPKEIERGLAQGRERLAALGPADAADATGQARRKSLEDTVRTLELRRENFDRARNNAELIELELARLKTKITALGEMAISRQDPNFLSGEIDAASASAQQTEKAMADLEFLSGLEVGGGEGVPDMMKGHATLKAT